MKRFALGLAAVPVVLALMRAPVLAQTPPEAQPQEDPEKGTKPKDDPRLVVIGGLGANALYASYMLVGVTADGFAKDVYTADQVTSIVDSVISVFKVNKEQLAALRKMELTEEDAKSLDEMIGLIDMISEYADLLGKYAKEKDPKMADAFQEHRAKTWERLKKLLGIK